MDMEEELERDETMSLGAKAWEVPPEKTQCVLGSNPIPLQISHLLGHMEDALLV